MERKWRANGFPDELHVPLVRMAEALQPHLPALQAALRRKLGRHQPGIAKAIQEITPGAAAEMLACGRPVPDFFEQVDYNGGRLAKLNVSQSEIAGLLREYDLWLEPLSGGFQTVREQLRLATVLTLHHSFYQVREAESQALYELFQAELETQIPEELLDRFAAVLRRTFRAQAARLHLFGASKPARISRRHYIETGGENERLILDVEMRGRHRSYWSIPFFSRDRAAGVIQLGFSKPYRWLPRELQLLDAVAERCLAAAERSRLIQDLAAREKQVRHLAEQITRVEEEERRRISRELHDEAGQSLLFIRLQLERLENSVPGLTEVRQVVERTIAEIRRVISSLSPAVLEQLGLVAAVRQLTERFRGLYPARVTLRLPEIKRYSRDTEIVVYRLLQECYQNIAKHSGASRVKVSLRPTDEWLELSVSDDGVGFDLESVAAKQNSFGLTGMRERVALLGGEFRIRSAPGSGVSIRIRLPVTTQKHGEDSSIPYR